MRHVRTHAWALLATVSVALGASPALAIQSGASGPAAISGDTNPQGTPVGPSSGDDTNPQQAPSGPPPPGGITVRPGLDITYGGEVATKLQVDGAFVRGQRNFAEPFNKTIGTGYVNLGESFAVRGEVTLERFKAQSATTAFNGEGLYLSQLYGVYSFGPVFAYAGKIHPRFSVGYEQAPGLYDTFANDYEQKERIGFGALVRIFPSLGRHFLSAETYFLDTSVLSQSVLARPSVDNPATLRPGRLRRYQGGPSNPGNFSSYDVALDGSLIPGLERLRYHLGFTQEGVSQPGEKQETGATAFLSYSILLTPRITLTPLVEVATFRNFAGVAGEDRTYVIGAAEFEYRRWTLSFLDAMRRVRANDVGQGGSSRWDNQFNATLTRRIAPRLFASVGYNHIRDTGQVSDTVSVALDYALRF